ncbi:MAG: electron transport complex protein RnfG [Paraglaciecola sp.]|jgi:electron transport complex protein RnfG
MNDQATIPTFNSMKMLRAMVGISVICGVLIVSTYEATLPRIEKLRAEALKEAIFEVIPDIAVMKSYSYENGIFTMTESNSDNVIFAGYNEQELLVGLAIPARGQGYAGTISILYGYNPINQEVIGFGVLESKETPGLGDKIEKDQTFLANFSALDVSLDPSEKLLNHPVTTVKSGEKVNAWEIDGITGATISSRAIGVIINESVSSWAPIITENQTLFSNINNIKKSN